MVGAQLFCIRGEGVVEVRLEEGVVGEFEEELKGGSSGAVSE
jgi:hypothetical protein